MSKPKVYLAGPITNCTLGEANYWRSDFGYELEGAGIIGVSPLRCEPLIGDTYTPDNPDLRFGVPRAIFAKNMLDIRMTDLTLAYFPKELPPSLGTIFEMGVAYALNKPLVVVSEREDIKHHPLVGNAPGWRVDTFEEAIDIITGVLSVYR